MMELLTALEGGAFSAFLRESTSIWAYPTVFETTQRSRALAMVPGADTPLMFKMIGGVSLVSWLMVLYWGRMMPFAVGSSF